jgi:RimJ/RimL family protein N-acetyltransferase
VESVTRWVTEGQAQALAGEALLIVSLDAAGEVAGYSRITVWPDRSAAELAGAMRADLQGRGQGGPGMAHSFGWIFETLGVRLMCLTAALDNIRVQKGIDGAGFVRMGERDAVRPDGTIRRSVYWEMTRDAWRMRHRL